MLPMEEAHFSGMSHQSSIYGLTSLLTGATSHKVLMASSKRKVYCIEYSRNKGLVPSTTEVQFTYIPGGAEIISIDAFNQACQEHDFVVGITFVKIDSGGKRSQYFNIYSDWEPNNECVLDNIAQGCLSIGLDFIPFHLTHTELEENEMKETVWLLSGSDCKIHLFREDKSRQTYCEQSNLQCFPEFEVSESVVLWMDIMTSATHRIVALGCKNGTVIVSLVKLIPEIQVCSFWKTLHDSPISSVRLFQDSVPSTSNIQSDFHLFSNNVKEMDLCSPVNLVVVSTLESSVVYRNVLDKGLSSPWVLPGSKKFDCATCCLVADIDMDGRNEIILGTHGQQLLVYGWEIGAAYALLHQLPFPSPLLSVGHVDLTADGLRELLVLTTRGLHVLQHRLTTSKTLCVQRMKRLAAFNSDEKDLLVNAVLQF